MADPTPPSTRLIPLFSPPPIATKMYDKDGSLSRPWALWYASIYEMLEGKQSSGGNGYLMLE